MNAYIVFQVNLWYVVGAILLILGVLSFSIWRIVRRLKKEAKNR